jgi:hypothetical protein
MARRRFRWTRKLYRQADSLARFIGRHMYELPDQPNLVRRYFELWERHPQRDDPLNDPMWLRKSRRGIGDDIPF